MHLKLHKVSAAAVSAIIAMVAAGISVYEAKDAKKRNDQVSRQSLTMLVTDITEQTRLLASARGVPGEASAQARLADAEEGLALSKTLSGPIPAIDFFELGVAFEGEGDDFHALEAFERAANDTSSPHIQSVSLRLEAGIRYALGNNVMARDDIDKSLNVFSDQQDITAVALDRNEAYTDLFDVVRSSARDCPRARAQLHQANTLVERVRPIRTEEVLAERKEAERAVAAHRCD